MLKPSLKRVSQFLGYFLKYVMSKNDLLFLNCYLGCRVTLSKYIWLFYKENRTLKTYFSPTSILLIYYYRSQQLYADVAYQGLAGGNYVERISISLGDGGQHQHRLRHTYLINFHVISRGTGTPVYPAHLALALALAPASSSAARRLDVYVGRTVKLQQKWNADAARQSTKIHTPADIFARTTKIL